MAPKKSDPGKDARSVNKQIDDHIRRVYDDALSEDVPDRFRDLLSQLKQKEGADKDGQ